MKIAVEGCMHGELNKMYETITEIENREGYKIDLVKRYFKEVHFKQYIKKKFDFKDRLCTVQNNQLIWTIK